ncbi:hypothetical protein CYJ46_08770 [Corynebacterium coyleae]|uniref:hypothetical protein n=1 Tax=Corynebacterium coyleae TaxID=53374 RepID=UPI000C791421|nr:hypothetical protein [Corynebacterium coyleae]PLA37518.1 hypothetical protein CYJ46_08770 [Corynebacterium coyleae]
MDAPNTYEAKPRGRSVSVVLGLIFIAVVIAAVALGRGLLPFGSDSDEKDSGGESNRQSQGNVQQLHGVIGSEKRAFFEDPKVKDRLAALGYSVSVTTAGSRQIATTTDIAAQDFVFPSSGPATQKVREQGSGYSVDFPFFSPMAVASWKPIADLLVAEGVVAEQNGAYTLDVNKYMDLARSGKRWRDLEDAFPSPRNVQVRSTDIRTSNSAAMYLSLLAWEVAQREPDRANDVGFLVDEIAPFFTAQGYSEASSSGPFADYLSQGMGAVPMVMVYEAQFIGEQMRDNSRIRDDMVLLQLSPTVLANHGIVGVSEGGRELGRLLTNDPELQRLAAYHGFRPATSGNLAQEMEDRGLDAPADYVNSIDPPSYDRLEQLIDGVGQRYGGAPAPVKEEE